MRDPFLVAGPAMIQFSGGRTSAYMLWRILQAHGGVLPDDVVVSFQNTGLEWPATYRFVEQVQVRWNVPVVWLEWRPAPVGFEIVGSNSADRTGFWFKILIEQRSFLPNSVARYCTIVLKIRAAAAFAKSLGWKDWTAVIGIRADEEKRIAKGRARNEGGKDGWDSIWPLHAAGITKADVLAFWKTQPFDLELPSESFGNCSLCHLKAREKLLEVMLHDISAGDWWVDAESKVTEMVAPGDTKTVIVDSLFGEEEMPAGQNAARFRRDGWTYGQMQDYVRDYPAAAQREVDRFKRELAAGVRQGDLLEDCLCGVGA